MNRRNLIKTLGISAIGLATIPFWINGWTEKDLPPTASGMDESQKRILAELVETIIPSSETPGAKKLKIDQFVMTMVNDCYEKVVQVNFLEGISALEASSKNLYNSSFTEISESEKIDLLESSVVVPESKEGEFNFVPFVKSLTVAGYMTSKYYYENILHYELVPARFNGSIHVNQTIYKNS
jgi:hypothetical protein